MTEGRVAASERASFDYWPEDRHWSFQLQRLLGQGVAGGADFAEVHLAARRMQVGNAEDWYNGFAKLAQQVEDLAKTALAGGHIVSARECWLRASSYYRSAEFMLPLVAPRKEAIFAKSRSCFLTAIKHASPAIEAVEIPYEETALYGYFYHPRDAKPPYKVLMYFGGGDSTGEELYFAGAKAVSERGFACLVVDGPGVGASLRLRNIYSRYDYEVPVTAAIDYLETRPDVDTNRIALMAWSLGGYYAPRAAAFERRVKACIAWGGNYDVYQTVTHLPNQDFFVGEVFRWLLGTKSDEETLNTVKRFTLNGIVDKITCPLLVTHGEDDHLVGIEHAYRTYEEAKCDKTLKIFKHGEPGAEHCQIDAFGAAHYYMYNWLEEKVK